MVEGWQIHMDQPNIERHQTGKRKKIKTQEEAAVQVTLI